MSQGIYDKVINHYIARYVLEYKLSKYLDIRNVATRKNMGSSYGIKLIVKYIMTKSSSKELVLVGKTKHCFVNKENKPIVLKKQFPELDQKLKEFALSKE